MPTAKPKNNGKDVLKAKRLEALEELIMMVDTDIVEDFVVVGMDSEREGALWIGCENHLVCLGLLDIGKDMLKSHMNEKRELNGER